MIAAILIAMFFSVGITKETNTMINKIEKIKTLQSKIELLKELKKK